jgi:hypothetical protein
MPNATVIFLGRGNFHGLFFLSTHSAFHLNGWSVKGTSYAASSIPGQGEILRSCKRLQRYPGMR